MRVSIILIGVIVVATTMSACTNTGTEQQPDQAEHRLDRPADDTITHWAEDALRLDPRISSADIKVRTLNGIVKLTGTADSVQAKDYAKLEVTKIDGVRGVIDELDIRPSERTDAEITTDVIRRLTHSPAVRCEDLAIDVADGAVTLHGKVAGWNERDYATTLAGEVRGVREVANEMQLSFREPRTDEQNRDEIVAAIDQDPYLTGLPVTIRVAGGIVTLEGTVGNLYEKERAESDALRVGTVSVVDNQLEVEWWKDRGVRNEHAAVTDDEIQRAVQDSLEQDLRIMRPSDITIAVKDRSVTLKGSASDYYQKTIARQDAKDIVGVRNVVDLIDIDRSSRNDEAIASELALDLHTDYALADREIGVFVDGGTATLRGEVRSPFEREHAEVVAASVPGVRGVVNDILVRPAVGYSDEALKESIESRLAANWRTRAVAPRIHVVVENGSATLTGEIDSWPERMEAGRIARLVEGVTEVTNDLSLVGNEVARDLASGAPER